MGPAFVKGMDLPCNGLFLSPGHGLILLKGSLPEGLGGPADGGPDKRPEQIFKLFTVKGVGQH